MGRRSAQASRMFIILFKDDPPLTQKASMGFSDLLITNKLKLTPLLLAK